MKIIDVLELYNTSKQVHCPNKGFYSMRVLVESDGMGFSMTETTIHVGDTQRWHYKHHLEACYCISGFARIQNEITGETYELQPRMVYVLDKHDPHLFTAIRKTRLVCVFNPPLKGNEVHKEDGSYEI